jgi:hypothetical protein
MSNKTNPKRHQSSLLLEEHHHTAYPTPSLPSSPNRSVATSDHSPPVLQTVIYHNLPIKLKENIPYISETIRIIQIRLGQEIYIDSTSLLRLSTNGNIAVIYFWSDSRVPEQLTCIYKTINAQLIILKVVLRNKPLIVVINCGWIRGSQCFFVEGTYTKETKNIEGKNNSGFNFGLQAYAKWNVPGKIAILFLDLYFLFSFVFLCFTVLLLLFLLLIIRLESFVSGLSAI